VSTLRRSTREADAKANVEPNLPPGIKPNRSYHELHTAFTG
jgi:hypothetical protein